MKYFFILFFFATSVFALEKKGATEYIVSGPGISIEVLKKTFKRYPPDSFRPLSKGNFLIQYKKDPGLKALQNSAGKTLKIQSNFIYKTLK